jgi:predicted amidohydrolase
MKIALSQMIIEDNISANTDKVLGNIRLAAERGAELIFFPELTLTPFFPSRGNVNAERFLTDINGAEISAVREACRKNGIAASPNIYLREESGQYDANVMIDSRGEILGISKMVHVSSFPNFCEAEYYTPSDGGFNVYELSAKDGICRVGVVICYDRHFPESVRCCALEGADIVIIPTANMVGEPDEMFLWELRVQAMQNSVFIAMCNRAGESAGFEFSGLSAVVDCRGNVMKYADGGERLIVADIDFAESARVRNELPYFSARRPDRYLSITREKP